jgi:hypothetical protein
MDNCEVAAYFSVSRIACRQNVQTYYDAKKFSEIAALMTSIVGKPFRYPPSPDVFLQSMKDPGAEMAYMDVYDHWKRYAAGTIPGADSTFENFPQVNSLQNGSIL